MKYEINIKVLTINDGVTSKEVNKIGIEEAVKKFEKYIANPKDLENIVITIKEINDENGKN